MMLSCQNLPKNTHKYEEISNCIDSMSIHLMNHDSLRFSAKWNELIAYDTLAIDYLINCCRKNTYNENKMFWYDMKTRKGFARFYEGKKNRIDYLYLISALYYRDYFFACDRVIYDIELAKKMNESALEGLKLPVDHWDNDTELIDSALQIIIEWRKINSGNTLFNYKSRPFIDSELYWLCEDSTRFNRGDFGWDYEKLKRDYYNSNY